MNKKWLFKIWIENKNYDFQFVFVFEYKLSLIVSNNHFYFLDRCKPLAVASLGPYGACLLDGSEYKGDYVDNIPISVILVFAIIYFTTSKN